MSKPHDVNLICVAALLPPDPVLVREVMDAQWADNGRLLFDRLSATDDLITVINRAGLRSKSVKEMVGYIRAYMLTGSKP